jgi:hypothetical protein
MIDAAFSFTRRYPRRFRRLAAEPLPVNPLVPLVKIDAVTAITARPPDAIYNCVDTGQLCWVFNLAANAARHQRDLRFWSREIAGYDVHTLKLKTVIDEILGAHTTFQSGEVCLLFSIRRPTLLRLSAQLGGGQTRSDATYTRGGLATFLNHRFVS